MKRVKRASMVLAIVAGIMAVAMAGFAMRLAFAPLDLAFARSFVNRAAAAIAPGSEVSYGRALAVWNTETDRFEIRLYDVLVRDRRDGLQIRLPRLELALSMPALLIGRVKPAYMEITGARVRLGWSKTRFWAWATKGETRREGELPPLLDYISNLLKSKELDLRGLAIRDLDLDMQEEESGARWRLMLHDVSIKPDNKGLAVALSARLSAGGGPLSFHGGAKVDRNTRNFNANLVFSGFQPGGMMRELAVKTPIAGIAMAFGGTLQVNGNLAKGLDAIGGNVSTGGGKIELPDLYPVPMTVSGASVAARYLVRNKLINLQNAALTLGEAKFGASGAIRLSPRGPALALQANVNDLAVRQLVDWWPEKFDKGARRWIDENMPAGKLTHAEAALHLAPGMSPETAPRDALAVDFAFSGLSAHYAGDLPPIEAASGSGHLDFSGLSIKIDSARSGGMRILPSRLAIRDLFVHDRQVASAEANVQGSIRQALDFIDRAPLKLTSKLKLDREKFDGMQTTRIKIDVPLVSKGGGTPGIAYRLASKLENASWRHLLPGGDMTEGALMLNADPARLTLKGSARLKGVLMNVNMSHEMKADGKSKRDPTVYLVDGAATPLELAAFGIPAPGHLSGPSRFTLKLSGNGGELHKGAGRMDLGGAQLVLPVIGWVKPAGAGGVVDFAMRWNPKGLLVEGIRFSGQGMDVSGQAALEGPGGAFSEARFRVLNPENDLTLNMTSTAAGMRYRIRGARLDARSFIHGLFGSGSGTSQAGEGAAGPENYTVDLDASQVKTQNGVDMTDVKLDLAMRDDVLVSAALNGTLDTGHAAAMTVTDSAAPRNFKVTSGDGGRLALGLGVFVNGKGGDLLLQGTMSGPFRALSAKGSIKVKKFHVVKTSLLTKVLEQGEKGGIDKYLDSDGYAFDSMSIPFSLNNRVIDISGARAHGPSIGFTMEGQVDQSFTRLNINGTIVPAYGLNTLIGKLPLIGNLITGGAGRGLFGVNYRIKGKMEKPSVSVNAFAALAPGFLRRLFEGSKGKIAPETLPPETEETPETAPEVTPENSAENSAENAVVPQ